MEDKAASPGEERVRAALRLVEDPEVGMNIVDLGLIYRIDVAEERVRVAMTMTSAACPMGDMIVENARRALGAALPPAVAVEVVLVFEPAWTPAMMSERARQMFGWSG